MGEDKKQWLKELNDFAAINPEEVPSQLLIRIRKRIFPNPKIVFSKIALIHAAIGFCSLAVCNQFGLNPFQVKRSLADWFMGIGGHEFCMFSCGLFFLSATYSLANLILTLEELEVIRQQKRLQVAILTFVSLGVFHFFGAETAAAGSFWIAGGLLGGILSIESGYSLRKSWA